MTTSEIRVVFDTMVFLQAMVNRHGPAKECWDDVESGKLKLVTCPACLVELAEVVSRPKVARKLGITTIEADAFLRAIYGRAILVENPPIVFPLERDRKDEKVLNTAIVGQANYLVTRDLDLLDLVRTQREDAQAFRAMYSSIAIVTPSELRVALAAQQGDTTITA